MHLVALHEAFFAFLISSAFLASDNAAFITGASLDANRGIFTA
jgi:hypothetical protein